jgi:aerobic C4-dicarboxylate transport protein
MSSKLLNNGTLHLLLAITCGFALGLLRPELAVAMRPLSDFFIRAVGLLMPFIMFVLVCSGVAGIQRQEQRSRLVGKIVIYFQVMSVISLLLGMTTLLFFEVDRDALLQAPQVHPVAVEISLGSMGATISGAFHNLVLQVMVAALICGMLIGRSQGIGERLHSRLEQVRILLFRVLHIVLKFAPLAAFGAMAFTVGKYGMVSVMPLIKFVAVIYLACAVFIVVVLAGVSRLVGEKLLRIALYVKEELLLVAFTGSSVAAIPGLVGKLEQLGCDRKLVHLIVTTGYTFNLSGSSIYLTTAIMFMAHLSAVDLTGLQLASLLLICMLTSLGSTSVAGSAFFTLIATLTVLQVIPLEGVGLLLGVERLMKCRSLTNVLGNCVACIAICRWHGAVDRVALRRELAR